MNIDKDLATFRLKKREDVWILRLKTADLALITLDKEEHMQFLHISHIHLGTSSWLKLVEKTLRFY